MPKHAPKGRIKGDDEDEDDLNLMGPEHPKGSQCTARSKTSGQRCRQPAIPGAVVCHYHGGAAPQVQNKAMERLLALQSPAIDTLCFLMRKRAKFPSTAYAAARDVLDRTEGKAIDRVQNEHKGEIVIRVEKPW